MRTDPVLGKRITLTLSCTDGSCFCDYRHATSSCFFSLHRGQRSFGVFNILFFFFAFDDCHFRKHFFDPGLSRLAIS